MYESYEMTAAGFSLGDGAARAGNRTDIEADIRPMVVRILF
jgi:hypothetical protein